MRRRAFIISMLSFALTISAAANWIHSTDARYHIGENATICGRVGEVFYFETISYLSLDKPYAQGTFLAALAETAGFPFGNISRTYSGRSVCVSGRIQRAHLSTEIIVADTAHIRLVGAKGTIIFRQLRILLSLIKS
jgi:hypothetical protein